MQNPLPSTNEFAATYPSNPEKAGCTFPMMSQESITRLRRAFRYPGDDDDEEPREGIDEQGCCLECLVHETLVC